MALYSADVNSLPGCHFSWLAWLFPRSRVMRLAGTDLPSEGARTLVGAPSPGLPIELEGVLAPEAPGNVVPERSEKPDSLRVLQLGGTAA